MTRQLESCDLVTLECKKMAISNDLIQEALKEIEEREEIKILYACGSGLRIKTLDDFIVREIDYFTNQTQMQPSPSLLSVNEFDEIFQSQIFSGALDLDS